MNGIPILEDENDLFHVVQEHADPLGDVFGSEPTSPTLAGREQQDAPGRALTEVQELSDIPRLRSIHVTNGYREGIGTGKEKHMQGGFDEGYGLGAELGLKVGWCLGVLDGIYHALPSTAPSNRIASKSAVDQLIISREDVRKLQSDAEAEMSLQNLFSQNYFHTDYTWRFDVPESQKDADDITFETIAAAHPLVKKWVEQVTEISRRLGLNLQ
ncbi:hypothetical protein M433DRAFT_67865 [Acidomyces richmondensis BFW]|nr:hypothetical protein M433DRAFT_67865 [Acidomyces richmondensis BFW]